METHWLVRPHTIRLLWMVFAVMLALTVGVEWFVPEPADEGLASTFGFGAWFGFGACAVLILFAKGVGVFLKRPDNFYDSDDD